MWFLFSLFSYIEGMTTLVECLLKFLMRDQKMLQVRFALDLVIIYFFIQIMVTSK